MAWVRAENAPQSWEGNYVWMWTASDKKVEVRFLQKDFSREPHHCEGIMLHEWTQPLPPSDDDIAAQGRER